MQQEVQDKKRTASHFKPCTQAKRCIKGSTNRRLCVCVCVVCVWTRQTNASTLITFPLSSSAVTNFSNSTCAQHRPIVVNATSGYISTLTLGETGHGSSKCPIVIKVSPPQ